MPSALITRRQQLVLDAIVRHIEDRGYPPTVREIGAAVGIRSPNGVAAHLAALRRRGRIVVDPRLSRGITVPGVRAGGFSLPILKVA